MEADAEAGVPKPIREQDQTLTARALRGREITADEDAAAGARAKHPVKETQREEQVLERLRAREDWDVVYVRY